MNRKIYEFGPFQLDADRRVLSKHGNALDVGQRAIAILEALLGADGQPVSKATLMDAAWPQISVEENNLTVQISALRKAMGLMDDGGHWIITKQRGGYQLPKVPSSVEPSAVPVRPVSPHALGKPSIAVLPFESMSPDPAHAYFSDGLTEDITTALGKYREFFVIARITMSSYKDRAANMQEMRKELSVDYFLDGSVRAAGEKMRVSAQLVNAATNSQIWAEKYDRTIDDIFAIQDEISGSVIARLGNEVLAAEHMKIVRKQPENLTAWECFIRALYLASRLSEKDSAEALNMAEQAIASDPDYAQALGLWSWLKIWRAAQGWDEFADSVQAARVMSSRAIAADDSEPWAWVGQGSVGLMTRDSPLTITSLEKAVELNPNFAIGRGLLGLAYAFSGRAAEAVNALDLASDLSPREMFLGAFAQQYAFAYFQMGNYRRALDSATKAAQLRPGHVYAAIIAAASAAHLGEMEEAERFVKTLLEIVPNTNVKRIEETTPYVRAADRIRLLDGLTRAGLT
jgi:adenylate cyclase